MIPGNVDFIIFIVFIMYFIFFNLIFMNFYTSCIIEII